MVRIKTATFENTEGSSVRVTRVQQGFDLHIARPDFPEVAEYADTVGDAARTVFEYLAPHARPVPIAAFYRVANTIAAMLEAPTNP